MSMIFLGFRKTPGGKVLATRTLRKSGFDKLDDKVSIDTG
jgi:hypothetical protein